MKLDNLLQGTHNGKAFTYHNGTLTMFSHIFNKNDIQTLVETANLLEIEGHKLKVSKGTKVDIVNSPFYGRVEQETDIYDEE